MLKDAPVIENIIGEVLGFIGDLPLLGHNIRFDYSFLKQAAVNQKMEFECEAVDTLKLCRKLMPEQEKKNLGNACIYYKIEQPLTHRAEADALSAPHIRSWEAPIKPRQPVLQKDLLSMSCFP